MLTWVCTEVSVQSRYRAADSDHYIPYPYRGLECMGRGGGISDTQGSISLFHGLTSWHNRLSGKQVAGALGVWRGCLLGKPILLVFAAVIPLVRHSLTKFRNVDILKKRFKNANIVYWMPVFTRNFLSFNLFSIFLCLQHCYFWGHVWQSDQFSQGTNFTNQGRVGA